jgi:hypothetical protein
MPRFHRINGERVQFTDAEETARDAEESALKKEMADAKDARSARTALSDQIGSDSATLKDVLAFLRAGGKST